MMGKTFNLADLFCGAGGTSNGAIQGIREFGYVPRVRAVNHWEVACATYELNHPDQPKPLHTSVDNVNPRELYGEGELDMLWASPECTHHSVARGGRPINDQSRATAWCVVRWAEALRPPVILIENVPEFLSWGGIGTNGRPLATKKGATFMAWVGALESLGYRVGWKILCAADYGDPTTRRRLFVQAVRGHRRIVWPEPSHAPLARTDLMSARKGWVAAREIIDWGLESPSIYTRKKPLSDKTLARIYEGLQKFGLKPFVTACDHTGGSRPKLVQPFIVPQFGERPGQRPRAHSVGNPLPAVTSHGAGALIRPFIVELRGTSERQIKQTSQSVESPIGTVTAGGIHHGLVQSFLVNTAHKGKRQARSVEQPLPAVCGNRGDMAVCEPALLPQQSDGRLRPVSEPAPTIATAGAVALVEPYLVKYHGTGGARSVGKPFDTVTTKDRFGLARPVVVIEGNEYLLDIGFRMLQPHELAAAQGFPKDYKFTGTKTDQVKQIGNAVPCGLSRALVYAVLSQ